MIRVLVVDDHAVVRRGVQEVLRDEPDIDVRGSAADAAEALQVLEHEPIDVVVLDLRLGADSGIRLCQEIRSRYPKTRCLVFTALSCEEAMMEAVIAGATGYLLKTDDSARLARAVRAVARGEHLLDPKATRILVESVRRSRREGAASLTPQEEKVLYLLGRGLTNREIAETLFLAPQTVKNYVSSVLSKLGLPTRTQAALYSSSRHRDSGEAAER
ncbi:MAG TPA: response regulator transcription factor [Actinomycetota bacterium]|nr:response regulator transcription factor [Actinomycetota bacterium]